MVERKGHEGLRLGASFRLPRYVIRSGIMSKSERVSGVVVVGIGGGTVKKEHAGVLSRSANDNKRNTRGRYSMGVCIYLERLPWIR